MSQRQGCEGLGSFTAPARAGTDGPVPCAVKNRNEVEPGAARLGAQKMSLSGSPKYCF
jgi:hypothetical protein